MERTVVNAFLLRRESIECNGKPLVIRLKKAQALLFYLLIRKKATREELTGLLWGGEDEELARRHLRDNLYHLKKAAPIELIVPNGRSEVQLNPEVAFHIDVDEFLAAEGFEAYQDGFLPTFSAPDSCEYELWIERMRTALRNEYLQRLDRRAQELLEDGIEDEAVDCWQRYLQEEPLSESVSASLMRVYRERRDYNRAALVYRGLHKAMSDDLGITPLKETSELYYSIMKEWNERADTSDMQNDDFLVGRQKQLQDIQHLFSHARQAKHRRSFVLLGEAGVGKSHLLAYFLAHGNVDDFEILTASCFKSKQDEYLYPWQTLMLSIASYIENEDIRIPEVYLQAVSALFPVFDRSGIISTDKRSHLLIDSVMSFDSALAVLSFAASKKPLLLVLEDIQWIDRVSLSLLDQMLHKISAEHIVFAATCRQPETEPVAAFLRGAEEDGLCQCYTLQPFTREETMQYIELCGARGMSEEDKEHIFLDTQGNAFLLTQLIGSIMENGQPNVLPRSMEEILSYRLSGLSTEGLQVLNLVAMFPDYAPYRVLERVSSRPTLDLLYVCQELCRRSILAEVYDGGNLSLVFTQAEFRDMTYEHIAPLSRRILHLNIAQVLTTMPDTGLPNLDTLTAYHYERGGDRFHAFQYKVKRFKTYVFCNYALLNGMPYDTETLLNDTPEAMRIFHRMELEFKEMKQLHPKDETLERIETDLYYSMGCFCIYRGLYEEGTNAISHLLENPLIPVSTRELAHEQMTFYGIQTYRTDVMREHIETALALTKDRDKARYAINRRYNGYRLVMEGKYAEGREELLRTLMLLRDAIGDEVELRLQSAYAHDYIGEAYRKQGLYAEAIEEYRIAANTIDEYVTSTSRPMFFVDLCMAELMTGDYDAARQSLVQSQQATETVKEPSGYFRTLYCACSALFAFADKRYSACVEYLEECEQLTRILVVPYDTGILYLIEAIIRCRCDAEGIHAAELDAYLTETYLFYCAKSRRALEGKMGVPERELLEKLERGDADIFPGLFQVTLN